MLPFCLALVIRCRQIVFILVFFLIQIKDLINLLLVPDIIFILLEQSQLFVETCPYFVRRKWLLKSQIAHDHGCSLLPRVEVVFDLHDELWIADYFIWHGAHFFVWNLPLLENLSHL